MHRLINLLRLLLGIWIVPLSAYEYNNAQEECIVEFYDLTGECFYDPFSSDCCPWEVYLGATGFGATREINRGAVGLDDFFGIEGGKRRAHGALGGTVLGLTYRHPQCLYFNVEFDWAMGEHHRRGCAENFRASTINEFITDIKLGYNFSCRCFTFTPYAGIGNWTERYEISHGNKFHYCTWYGIVGARADWISGNLVNLGIDAEVFLPFQTRLKFNRFDSHINLRNGWGAKIEAPLKFSLAPLCFNGFFATFSPFYRVMEWKNSRFFTCDIETFRAPRLLAQDYGAKFYLSACF